MGSKLAEDRHEPVAPGADHTRLVSYRLSILSRHLAREGGRLYLAAIGLTLPQWRVVSTLGRFGELGATAIADHCAMDRGQTSRTIDSLISAGLIRLQQAVRDRRTTLYSLSSEGERRYASGLPIAFERQARLLAGFTDAEVETFSRMLDRMSERMRARRK